MGIIMKFYKFYYFVILLNIYFFFDWHLLICKKVNRKQKSLLENKNIITEMRIFELILNKQYNILNPYKICFVNIFMTK